MNDSKVGEERVDLEGNVDAGSISNAKSSSKRKLMIIFAVVATVLLLAFGGWYLFKQPSTSTSVSSPKTHQELKDAWSKRIGYCRSEYAMFLNGQETTVGSDAFAFASRELDDAPRITTDLQYFEWLKVVQQFRGNTELPTCALELFHDRFLGSVTDFSFDQSCDYPLDVLQKIAINNGLWILLEYTLMLGYFTTVQPFATYRLFMMRWFAPSQASASLMSVVLDLGLPEGIVGNDTLVVAPKYGDDDLSQDTMDALIQRVKKNPDLINQLDAFYSTNIKSAKSALQWLVFSNEDRKKPYNWSSTAIAFMSHPEMNVKELESWIQAGKSVSSRSDYEFRRIISVMLMTVFYGPTLCVEHLKKAVFIIKDFAKDKEHLVAQLDKFNGKHFERWLENAPEHLKILNEFKAHIQGLTHDDVVDDLGFFE